MAERMLGAAPRPVNRCPQLATIGHDGPRIIGGQRLHNHLQTTQEPSDVEHCHDFKCSQTCTAANAKLHVDIQIFTSAARRLSD